MKASCEKCGKIFDMEENLYICPKCNHYHSQVKHGRKTNIPKPQQKIEKMVRNPIWEKARPKKSIKLSKRKIIMIIVIIIFVMLTVIGCIGSAIEDQLSSSMNNTYEESEGVVNLEEDGELGFDGLSFDFEKQDKLTVESLEAPNGWKFIQIDFYRYYNDFDWSYTIKSSLICDGLYYKALSAYYVSDDEEEQDELYDSGLTDSIETMESGYMLFLVPESEKDAELKMWCISDNGIGEECSIGIEL